MLSASFSDKVSNLWILSKSDVMNRRWGLSWKILTPVPLYIALAVCRFKVQMEAEKNVDNLCFMPSLIESYIM